ncbi:MAG: 2-octaprenyl-6-methoxyphenyl hydroxylase [Gammaproteobacteria bacterium]
MDEPQFDILIAGGGMVGATLAVALADTGYRVGVIEARPFGEPGQPSYDDRSIALAWGSRLLLERFGLWEALSPSATPIHRIHVSDRGRFGAARLSADEEGVPALGYVVENRAVGAVLYRRLQALADVQVIAPAEIEAVDADPHRVLVQARTESGSRQIEARLLIAADGAQSTIRERLGFPLQKADYGQTALIANVTPEKDHAGIAFERFTDEGPLALLPMSEGRCSLVWTHRSEAVADTMQLDDAAFLERLQARFGWRLGRFLKVGQRAAYPLALLKSGRYVQGRVVLAGNAAHTLHPVAGQGFNLGLRDIAVLAGLLQAHPDEDPGDAALLAEYERSRQDDLKTVVRFTDTLARLFANPWPPLAHARAAGLVAVDLIPTLRHMLARQNMGLRARLPRL